MISGSRPKWHYIVNDMLNFTPIRALIQRNCKKMAAAYDSWPIPAGVCTGQDFQATNAASPVNSVRSAVTAAFMKSAATLMARSGRMDS